MPFYLLFWNSHIWKTFSFQVAGNEAFQAGKHQEAVEHYSAALACNSESRPFTAICFSNRAAAFQALGQITDAIADCSIAIALDPSYPKVGCLLILETILIILKSFSIGIEFDLKLGLTSSCILSVTYVGLFVLSGYYRLFALALYELCLDPRTLNIFLHLFGLW